MCALEIYVLNVGQGDTAILKTPEGNVVVIDAYRPNKVKDALDTISSQQTISHLIVTHPHLDHYNAASMLIEDYVVEEVSLAPFWHYAGTPMYHGIINSIIDRDIPLHFVGGYQRTYPDGGTFPHPQQDLYLELLGPPNDILDRLGTDLNPNHLSVMARLSYGSYCMVFAADAQMENWTHYDREGLLQKECNVLKMAHHGSKNGTQYERLDRLAPELAIVSSDLAGPHNLPDLVGSAICLEYDDEPNCTVALTGDAGTIKITAHANGQWNAISYGEGPPDPISGEVPAPLPQTDWHQVVASKV
jgi:competence protein ComEC